MRSELEIPKPIHDRLKYSAIRKGCSVTSLIRECVRNRSVFIDPSKKPYVRQRKAVNFSNEESERLQVLSRLKKTSIRVIVEQWLAEEYGEDDILE